MDCWPAHKFTPSTQFISTQNARIKKTNKEYVTDLSQAKQSKWSLDEGAGPSLYALQIT